MTKHWACVIAATCLAGCVIGPDSAKDKAMEKEPKTYHVAKLGKPIQIDGNWDKPEWQAVKALTLEGYMGEKPDHRPKVQAKLAYDDQAIYVIFRVEDRYVRAVAKQTNDSVCRDSCAEFFFTPGADLGLSYFNIEVNCGGTILLGWHPDGQKGGQVDPADCAKIAVGHSLPKIVEPEIAEPTTWTLEYRFPFDLIKKHCPKATKPAPGVTWKANLYKCADATSHPHWLTWSSVVFPRPRFHMPQFFGTLVFE
ncbi:MAG: carbohydrate-binding family 9-like protein [Planctomycetota bacterium]